MKHFFVYFFIIVAMLLHENAHAISIVYNFRIAQVTKEHLLNKSHKAKEVQYTLSTLPFNEYLKEHSGSWQNFAANLESFIMNIDSYYFRTDFAFAYVISKVIPASVDFPNLAKTETDDLLFTIGKSFQVNDELSLSGSLLLGFPTHRDLNVSNITLGFGQVGTGVQVDGQYTINGSNDIIFGTKYVYLIPTYAANTAGTYYAFTLGNIVDILAGYSKTFTEKHGMELGISERFEFGCKANPPYPLLVEFNDFSSTAFYAIYKYDFPAGDRTSNRLLFNVAYGFDNQRRLYDYKHIVTLWVDWGITF